MKERLAGTIRNALGSRTRVRGLFAIMDKAVVGLFGVVFCVLIIRQLSKEEFGAFILSESFRLILISSVDVAVGQAMIKYISERDAAEQPAILFNSFVFKIVLWVVCTAVLVALSFNTGILFEGDRVGELLRLLPVLMLAMLLNNLPKQFLTAKLDIKRVFILDLSLFALFLIGFYFFSGWLVSAGRVILFLSAIYIINSVQGWLQMSGKVSFALRFDLAWIKKLYFFSKHALANNIGMNIYNQSSPVIIGILMDETAVAVFGASMVFIQFFFMMGEAFNMILFPVVSRESRGEEGRARAAVMYEKYLSYMLIICVPAAVIFIAFPDIILDLLYDGKYNGTEAVTVLRFIGLWGIIAPFVRLLGSVVNGMDRPDLLAAAVAISAIAIIALNFAFIPLWGVAGSGAALLVSICVMFLAVHLLTSRFIKVSYTAPVAGAFRLCASLLTQRRG